jgi:selenocysteine lyase/cysteine desulfurase
MIGQDPQIFTKKVSDQVKLGDRSIFEGLNSKAYLNYAAFTPPSVLTKSIINAWFDDYASQGASAYILWANQRERLRERLAELINCAPNAIGYGDSTSGLISNETFMLDWKPKDRVLAFNGDFPSVIYPLKNAAKHFDLELVMHNLDGFFEDTGLGLELVEQELKLGLRLIAISSTQYQTGLLLPVKEIAKLCKKYGAELLVDAAQSCGAIDVDVTDEEINFLIAPTHKWLMGIEGGAFIYISSGSMERIIFRRTGWLSYHDSIEFLLGAPNKMSYDASVKKTPQFLEFGMSNSLGLAALEAGISTHLLLGMKNIAGHIQLLHDRIEAGLQNIGFQSFRAKSINARSSILSFLPPRGQTTIDMAKKFSEKNIAISTPDGFLRFAPSWPTNFEEVEYMLDAAKSF